MNFNIYIYSNRWHSFCEEIYQRSDNLPRCILGFIPFSDKLVIDKILFIPTSPY